LTPPGFIDKTVCAGEAIAAAQCSNAIQIDLGMSPTCTHPAIFIYYPVISRHWGMPDFAKA
jgi:hypothetical protein